MGVFLSYSHTRPYNFPISDFDDSISYVFESATFCCYSALNNAVCLKSTCGSDGLSHKAGVLFGFLNEFRGFFFFCMCDCVQFLWSGVKGFSLSRVQDSRCPLVFNQPALLALNLSQICSSHWPWIVLCPNIDPLKHSELLPDAQTTSALRHLKRLLQSMPLEKQKRGSESSLVLDVFYLTEYIFHAIYCCPLRSRWVPLVFS